MFSVLGAFYDVVYDSTDFGRDRHHHFMVTRHSDVASGPRESAWSDQYGWHTWRGEKDQVGPGQQIYNRTCSSEL